MNPSGGGWLIALTLLFALLLATVHLPEAWPQWLGWLRPSWVVVVMFFWVMELPHRLGLISAWLVGIALDVLQADPLGLNGLVLATITYLTWKFYERLRMYSVLQQSLVLFALVALGELLRTIIQDLLFDRGLSWGVLGIALVSAVVWPFVWLLLIRLKQQFRVE